MENAIGIDLGTTFSVAAVFDKDGRCRTLPSAEGDLTTPSVVYFDVDQPVVGKEAAKAGAFEPARYAYLAKRDMGKNHYSREILGQSLPPEVIQALVLRKIRADAEIQLGKVEHAVITVPAYFNEPRRKATQDAGKLAGLNVLDIINEPTAAAIAFGVQEGFLDAEGRAEDRELILVYDLGGGTFDATLMEIQGASYRALATGGDVHLGGVDWDQRIVDYAAECFKKEHGIDPRAASDAILQELRREAEDAKRALTARSTATMHVACDGMRSRVDLDRDKLQELTNDLTARTIFTCKKVLSDAKRNWDDVTRVLAVGGSSRMPLVQEALEAESGKKVDRSLSPDEAVAHGAAIFARLKAGGNVESISALNVTNVSSHDLGVLGVERATGMPRRKVLIPRNTPLPAQGSGRFVTREDGQADISVRVIEGGDAGGNHSTPIGRFLVDKLPPDLKKGSPIVVRFTYRPDGRLDVAAKVADIEGAGTMTVERASGLSEAELELWRGRIDRNQVVNQEAKSSTGAPAADKKPAAPTGDPNAPVVTAAAPGQDPMAPAPVTPNPAAATSESTAAEAPTSAGPAPAAPTPQTPAPQSADAAAASAKDGDPSDSFDELLDAHEIEALDDEIAGLLGEDDGPETAPSPAVETPIIDTGSSSPAPESSEPVNPAPVMPAPAEQEIVETEIVETEIVASAPVVNPTTAENPATASNEDTPEQPFVPADQAPAAAAPSADQLGIADETPKADPSSFDFLADQEPTAKADDDGDLQDFLSGLP